MAIALERLLAARADRPCDRVQYGWIFYRFGQAILVHQTLFVQDGAASSMRRKRHACSPYQCVSDDGSRISEWSTGAEAIRAF